MAAKKYHLIIEGTSTTDNGNLRQGFTKLLNKVPNAQGNFALEMGDGLTKAAWAFVKRTSSTPGILLLIDSDCAPEGVSDRLIELKLQSHVPTVFFMVQEMEAWFISQPEVLETFYGTGVTKKLAKKHASLFKNPKEELKAITKDSKKGTYQVVKHATHLLMVLDVNKLIDDFDDFKRLAQVIATP